MARKKKATESDRSRVARALRHHHAGSSWVTENVQITPTMDQHKDDAGDSDGWMIMMLATIRPCQADEVELLQRATRNRDLHCRAELDLDTSSIQVTCKREDIEKIWDIFQRLIDDDLKDESLATSSPIEAMPFHDAQRPNAKMFENSQDRQGNSDGQRMASSLANASQQKQPRPAIQEPEKPEDDVYAFW